MNKISFVVFFCGFRDGRECRSDAPTIINKENTNGVTVNIIANNLTKTAFVNIILNDKQNLLGAANTNFVQGMFMN